MKSFGGGETWVRDVNLVYISPYDLHRVQLSPPQPSGHRQVKVGPLARHTEWDRPLQGSLSHGSEIHNRETLHLVFVSLNVKLSLNLLPLSSDSFPFYKTFLQPRSSHLKLFYVANLFSSMFNDILNQVQGADLYLPFIL